MCSINSESKQSVGRRVWVRKSVKLGIFCSPLFLRELQPHLRNSRDNTTPSIRQKDWHIPQWRTVMAPKEKPTLVELVRAAKSPGGNVKYPNE